MAEAKIKKSMTKKKVKAATPPVSTSPIKGTPKMTNTQTTEAAADFSAKATEALKTVSIKAKEVFAKGSETAKEAAAFTKANVDASVEASKIAFAGTKSATEHGVELAKKNWEVTSAHVKALAAVKSPTDFFKLQGDFVRSQMDAVVAETAKATEFYTKLAGEVVAPLQNRYAVVVDQFKTRLAA